MGRARKVCLDCPQLAEPGQSRCLTHTRDKDKARGTRQQRGYGTEHRKLRARLLPQAVGQPCHFCGEPMLPGQPLALDHTEDRAGYRGMAHASCNSQDGGRRRHT